MKSQASISKNFFFVFVVKFKSAHLRTLKLRSDILVYLTFTGLVDKRG